MRPTTTLPVFYDCQHDRTPIYRWDMVAEDWAEVCEWNHDPFGSFIEDISTRFVEASARYKEAQK